MAQIFYDACGCIQYFMPAIDPNITICGHSESKCVEELKDEINLGKNDSLQCKCPYGCHGIKFDMDLSSAPIFEKIPFLKKIGISAKNTAILQVHYQQSVYHSQDMEELIGFTEFLCKNFCKRKLNVFLLILVSN